MDSPECFNWQTCGTSVRSCDVDHRLWTHYYLVWNLVCGFAQNESQLLVFCVLSGLDGSASLAVRKVLRLGL